MKKWALICCLILWTHSAFADESKWIDEVSVGLGQSKDHIDIYRLGLKKPFSSTLYKNNYGWLGGYYEASVNYWEKGGDTMYAFAFSPVFVYYFGEKSKKIHPYLEAGIGLSCLSDTMISGRNLSSHFNFEDRIGSGIRMEHFDLNGRYMHYSNAGLKKPNQGIDIIIFTLSYIF